MPADHLLRRIDALFDFGFGCDVLAASYSTTGRPSIDPELMLLVGYLSGIRSDRCLCEEVHLNLAYRWFCRLDLGGRVPDHSTFSKNRHDRFRACELHRLLFEQVVAKCAAAGLVAGRDVAVDGSTIMADASREKTLKCDAFFTRDAFRYDRNADACRCPADVLLGHCGTNRASQVRVYRSRPADCTACDLKPECTIGKRRGVTRLVSENARDTVRALAGTDAYMQARRRKQRIERVFGHLKRNLGLRTLTLRGLAGAAEEFTMAAAIALRNQLAIGQPGWRSRRFALRSSPWSDGQ